MLFIFVGVFNILKFRRKMVKKTPPWDRRVSRWSIFCLFFAALFLLLAGESRFAFMILLHLLHALVLLLLFLGHVYPLLCRVIHVYFSSMMKKYSISYIKRHCFSTCLWEFLCWLRFPGESGHHLLVSVVFVGGFMRTKRPKKQSCLCSWSVHEDKEVSKKSSLT